MFAAYFMDTLGRESLIAADDTWALLALLVVSVALAIWLEQKYILGLEDLRGHHCLADRLGSIQSEYHSHQLPPVR